MGAEAAPAEITLKEHLPILPLLLETVLWFVIIGALLFACGSVALQTAVSEITSLNGFWVAVIVVVSVGIGVLFALSLALQRRSSRAPAVIAGPDGLTQKTDEKATTTTLPWDEIRAWAIMLSPNHTQTQRRYVVCSERATLAWTERPDSELAGRGIQGDRRQAYQEQAEQLHSLIAARTGLPLREVTNR